MRITDEYLDRHSISNFNYVKYLSWGSLFVNIPTNSGCPWVLFSIEWINSRYGSSVGYFSIEALSPQRLRDGIVFDCVENSSIFPGTIFLHWDEYEDYIRSLANKLPSGGVVGTRKEVVLSAWEMFLYSADKHLAKLKIHDVLYRSIDLDLSLDERYLGFQDSIVVLSEYDKELFTVWKSSVARYVYGYSYWLADLVALDPGIENQS